ncbi:MAG: diaminopropionate ammonia-lyase [Solirubrobacteraceae bacterium]
MTRFVANAGASGNVAIAPRRSPSAFHARLPSYERTPLVPAPALADELGVAEVEVKDESHRLGLPAFKMLGASWATFRALEARAGGSLDGWRTIDELRLAVEPLGPLTLACATEGNHGRAVARMARLAGLDAHIVVPAHVAAPRVDAIRDEGGRIETVDGTYEDAVARSADLIGERTIVVSDTAWPGYEEIPEWVIEGYSTIFEEIAQDGAAPDVVAVQMGVGSLAATAIRHFRGRDPANVQEKTTGFIPPGRSRVRVLGVEPLAAACVMASIERGEMVTVPGPHDSSMGGLNCGRPSTVAWPDLSAGLDGVVAIDDDAARAAIDRLAALGLESGPSGAAGLGGLLALADVPGARERLGLSATSRVLVLNTEAATA